MIDYFGALSFRLSHQLPLQLVYESLHFWPIAGLGLLNRQNCAYSATKLGKIHV